MAHVLSDLPPLSPSLSIAQNLTGIFFFVKLMSVIKHINSCLGNSIRPQSFGATKHKKKPVQQSHLSKIEEHATDKNSRKNHFKALHSHSIPLHNTPHSTVYTPIPSNPIQSIPLYNTLQRNKKTTWQHNR